MVRLLNDRQIAAFTPLGGNQTSADASFTAIIPAGAFTETVTLAHGRLP